MKPLILFLTVSVILSCTRSGPPAVNGNGNCESVVTINEKQYNQASPNTFNIIKCEIKDDCLEVTITASGCSGSTWISKIVSNGIIAESYPPQRYLKIMFTNKEVCDAIASRKFTYNLKPMRVTGTNEVALNLKDWTQGLFYQYQFSN